MLKKLIELLPVSRRKYMESLKEITKTFKAITVVLEGFDEADANHCQIETNLIQHLQKGKMMKSTDKKSSPSNGTSMFG